jgi:hypothetical protein
VYKTYQFVNTITYTSRRVASYSEHLHETLDSAIEYLIAREQKHIENAKQEVKRSEARLKALIQKKARGGAEKDE